MGLDTGLAKSAVTRSDAMWLAENWKRVLRRLNTLTNHRPDHIRQECRDAGLEWALDQREGSQVCEDRRKINTKKFMSGSLTVGLES
jgi:hypothetical protein